MGLPLGQGEHVLLLHTAGHHFLALLHGLDGVYPVPQPGGQLELQILGGLLHLLGEHLHRAGAAPLDKVHRLLEGFVVLRLGDFPPAGGAALLDIVVEAGAALAKVLGELAAAIGQLEDFQGGIHRLLGGPRAHIGADVLGAVLLHLLDLGNAGPGALADPHIAVALVVL